MFGILVDESDNARQKRDKLNALRMKIGKAGITLRKLGDEDGVFIEDVVKSIKATTAGGYKAKRNYDL